MNLHRLVSPMQGQFLPRSRGNPRSGIRPAVYGGSSGEGGDSQARFTGLPAIRLQPSVMRRRRLKPSTRKRETDTVPARRDGEAPRPSLATVVPYSNHAW